MTGASGHSGDRLPGEGQPGLPLAPPVGMRDLLLPESTARRALGQRLRETFALWGYDLVTTPPFEHSEVLERGLETIDRRDLLRFVEPETGEVALLRPDITPQIARIVATRLRHRPPPWRLCYEGTVIRRRRGRARRQQQIAQAGVELVGWQGADADAEVLRVAAAACEAVGLEAYRIELRQVAIAHDALQAVPDGARAAAENALVHKDVGALEDLLAQADVGGEERRALLALAELYGDAPSVLERAKRELGSPLAARALAELEDVAERLADAGLGDRVDVDLGEVRGRAYYTGVSFTVLAEGPGEELGAGGRYDRLLERFDLPEPATGFALDIGNLEWALAQQGRPFRGELPLRFALAGSDAAGSFATALRARGVTVARLGTGDREEALAFARAWGYDAALVTGGDATTAYRTSDGAAHQVEDGSAQGLDELTSWASAARNEHSGARAQPPTVKG
ncbi:MAG: ATP phosphoribosyltransferase regulatory subunit [Polyangiales bacterium]